LTDLVTRVRTRATVLRPEIELLVMRAALACRYPNPGLIYRELVRRVGEDGLGIFVGHENASPMTLVVAILPDSPLMMAPQCPIVYSRGSRMLIRHVGERMREWVMAAGYDRVLSVSLTHSAAAWARSFRWLGEHKTLGTMIEVRF